MLDIRTAADAHSTSSLSNRLRAKRFSLFLKLVKDFPRPIRLLDVGGTNAFWEQRQLAGQDWMQITIGNLQPAERAYSNIQTVTLDATNLTQYGNGTFDVVFSNSVIEHLFTFDNQRRMAEEVQRVGRAHWIQTPNYWFPMEPHFHVPGWQWLPESMRVAIIRRRRCGWRGPYTELAAARSAVQEVRLLSRSEVKQLFPHSFIYHEKYLGLTKSFVAYGGFDSACRVLNSMHE